jgi:hypothetical protein
MKQLWTGGVDVASLAVFRIAFGAIMLAEALRRLGDETIGERYADSAVQFDYPGFGWIGQPSEEGLRVHFILLAAAAAGVMIGFFYRFSALALCLAWTWVLLSDPVWHEERLYFACLVSFLLLLVPAHRRWSVDAFIWRGERVTVTPVALWLLRGQVAVVYVLSALAQLEPDWLGGAPIRAWLEDTPALARLSSVGLVVHGLAWGVPLVGLLVVPGLLWRRTRLVAFAVVAVAEGACWLWLDAGLLPLLMIAGATLFFPPDWPRRGRSPAEAPAKEGSTPVLAVLAALCLLVQIAVPLRHVLYPGKVQWTGEGARFAWQPSLHRMTARATITVTDPAFGRQRAVRLGAYLNEPQIEAMAAQPELVRQFCHFLAQAHEADGYVGVEVRAQIEASLNGRPPQPLVDPSVDLAAEPRRLPAPWILPLVDG